MDIDNEADEKDIENDGIILKYETHFSPNINLFVAPISSLIEHLCPDISMIDIDCSLNNNIDQQIKQQIKSLKQEWTLKKWKSVIKHCQLTMELTSNRNHQISSINYHMASMQDLLVSLQNIHNNNSQKPYEIIENSSDFAALQILFTSNRDCILDSKFLSINELMQFYANLIIIQFKSGHYDIAQEMISNTLFEKTHFRKPFNKHIKSRNWSEIIAFWKNNESTSTMLKFIEKYTSFIYLVIIYISIQLKLDTIGTFGPSFKEIQWITQYLSMQSVQSNKVKQIKEISDQIYVLQSIYLLQQQKYKKSLLTLNKCCSKNMPLSIFMKGWINFNICDYQQCRKYFKQSAQSLSFAICQCLNCYAFMCVESNKYENALNYLQQSIHLTNDNENKSVYSFNWIQVYILLNKCDLNAINKVLQSIETGSNKCLLWEQSFRHKHNTQITKFHTLHIESQINLLLEKYEESRNQYEKLIGLISKLSIEDREQTLIVYQEFCCALVGEHDWKTLDKFISTIDTDDFQLNIIKIESLIQQKETQNVHQIIKEMSQSFCPNICRDCDKKKVFWWLRMFSGRCYEIENNLKAAEKHYELATMDKKNCLLTMYYHINVLTKMQNKGIEAAVCWLAFCDIPLNENGMFYQDINNNNKEIEKYLSEKMSTFNTFGINHKPSFCKNGVLFTALFEQKEYQVDKLKLIEITKYCLIEWVKALSTISMSQSLIQTFAIQTNTYNC